jgi:formimidoylglutamate deiminase
VRVAIGSDSQTIIDPLEEIRLIEYHERLRRMERVLLGTKVADRVELAPMLLRVGAAHGAASLRVNSGLIEPGRNADLVSVDLNDLSLAGFQPENLDAVIALSANPSIVRDVWVGGRQVIAERLHRDVTDIGQRYRDVVERVC